MNLAVDAAEAAVRKNPYVGALEVVVGLVGGYRATLWLLFAAWFAWSAHSWQGAAEAEHAQAVKEHAAAELAAEKLKAAQAAVTVQVVTKYVDRIVKAQGVTRTIIKEVPTYVPATDPDLSAGFRVLHDAAAQGVIPDPARIADAATVAAQDAASTVAGNYGTCHETEAQLISLQDWVRAQHGIH